MSTTKFYLAAVNGKCSFFCVKCCSIIANAGLCPCYKMKTETKWELLTKHPLLRWIIYCNTTIITMNHTSWLCEHFLNHGTWVNKERQNFIFIPPQGFDKFTQNNAKITKGLADRRAWYCLTPHPFRETTNSLWYNWPK